MVGGVGCSPPRPFPEPGLRPGPRCGGSAPDPPPGLRPWTPVLKRRTGWVVGPPPRTRLRTPDGPQDRGSRPGRRAGRVVGLARAPIPDPGQTARTGGRACRVAAPKGARTEQWPRTADGLSGGLPGPGSGRGTGPQGPEAGQAGRRPRRTDGVSSSPGRRMGWVVAPGGDRAGWWATAPDPIPDAGQAAGTRGRAGRVAAPNGRRAEWWPPGPNSGPGTGRKDQRPGRLGGGPGRQTG